MATSSTVLMTLYVWMHWSVLYRLMVSSGGGRRETVGMGSGASWGYSGMVGMGVG